MKAIHAIYIAVLALSISAKTASGQGVAIDLANVLENKVTIVPGVITDGVHTPKLQESVDGTTWTDVAAADMVGTFAALASNTPQEVGYIGAKRYLAVYVTVTGATTGGIYGAVATVKRRRS